MHSHGALSFSSLLQTGYPTQQTTVRTIINRTMIRFHSLRFNRIPQSNYYLGGVEGSHAFHFTSLPQVITLYSMLFLYSDSCSFSPEIWKKKCHDHQLVHFSGSIDRTAWLTSSPLLTLLSSPFPQTRAPNQTPPSRTFSPSH